MTSMMGVGSLVDILLLGKTNPSTTFTFDVVDIVAAAAKKAINADIIWILIVCRRR